MAIDNIFLGLGRKSVGDVTLYRRAGKQCARVRVRNIRNPRSYKQLFTRAILSNVAQLYATGIEIFNHSFEGRSPGMECQQRFSKLNVDRLRALMTDDYNSGAEPLACKARIGARNLKTAVPFAGLQVSEGSYTQSLYTYDQAGCGYNLPAANTGETVAAYAVRCGLVPDDIYTLICFVVDPTGPTMANYGPADPIDPYQCIFPCRLVYAQLKVRADVLTNPNTIASGELLSTFMEYYGGIDLSGKAMSNILDSDCVTNRPTVGGVAMIRSKWGTDLRSTSYLQPSAAGGMACGLTYHLLEQAWGDQSGINRADLILDGSNFEPERSEASLEDYVGMNVPRVDTTAVKAAMDALAYGQTYSVMYGAWLFLVRRGNSNILFVDYYDPLSAGTPSAKYTVTLSTASVHLDAYSPLAMEDGWINDWQDEMGYTTLQLQKGEPTTNYQSPKAYFEL